MIEDIETMAGLRFGPGTLYGAIARLESRKLIEPVAAEGRRQPYRLTAAGKKQLAAEQSRWDRIVEVIGRVMKPA